MTFVALNCRCIDDAPKTVTIEEQMITHLQKGSPVDIFLVNLV